MFDLQSLLQPLSDDAPSGSDLEYDPVFLELEVAGAGKLEQQYGDTVIPAKLPDWESVYEHALALAQRTRDLRVAMWLLRSGSQVQGWRGTVDALLLLHGLIEKHWATVHPRLDAADAGNPIMRLSALGPLSPQELPFPGPPPALAELRNARLSAERGSLTVRDIELAIGRADAVAGEMVPTESGVLEALRALIAQNPALPATMQAGLDAVDGMIAVLGAKLGSAGAPDLGAVRKVLGAMSKAARLATGAAIADEGDAAASGGAAPAGAPGAVNSRDDVVRTIDRLCDWIARHEPSNPAPLLLRRAQRLMSKNFIDIIRDIAPDGLEQINRLAGLPDNE